MTTRDMCWLLSSNRSVETTCKIVWSGVAGRRLLQRGVAVAACAQKCELRFFIELQLAGARLHIGVFSQKF